MKAENREEDDKQNGAWRSHVQYNAQDWQEVAEESYRKNSIAGAAQMKVFVMISKLGELSCSLK